MFYQEVYYCGVILLSYHYDFLTGLAAGPRDVVAYAGLVHDVSVGRHSQIRSGTSGENHAPSIMALRLALGWKMCGRGAYNSACRERQSCCAAEYAVMVGTLESLSLSIHSMKDCDICSGRCFRGVSLRGGRNA